MTATLSVPHDAADTLRWIALLERVYQQLDAVIAAGGAPQSASCWDGLFGAAAEYFQLEQLTLRPWPAPARAEPREWTFPLPAVSIHPSPGSDPRLLQPLSSSTGGPSHLVARIKPQSTLSRLLHAQLTQFVEHVVHCLHLQQHLEAERSGLDGVRRCLDAQTTAVVLSDAQGRAVYVNRAANELAERVPALQLGPGAIRFLAERGQDVLEPLFERARRGLCEPSRPRCEAASGGLLFTLLVLNSPATDDWARTGSGFGLIIQEHGVWQGEAELRGNRPLPSLSAHLRRRLQEHFGLTEKEVQLAHALAMGLTMGAYAERSQRSPQTLRKQVKSIFTKLNVHDQKSLILRVWQERQADWVECVNLLLGCDETSELQKSSVPALKPARSRTSEETRR